MSVNLRLLSKRETGGKSMRQQKFRKMPERSSILRDAPGIAFGILGFAAVGYFAAGDLVASVAATVQGCAIKGNVNINSGEKIFHVPGQEYYSATKISPQYGERWFCTEAEARAAGWRKAGK